MTAALDRRASLATLLLTGGGFCVRQAYGSTRRAQIAITLDLEMSRNFPTWEATHWDYEKGNLNAETIAYASAAGRRVRERGGRIHFFVVGRTLERENVDWLKALAAEGHLLGNHTYDHVNVRATALADLQYRFQRAPWLVAGRQPADVIRESIRLTNEAMKSRLGTAACGFRTPGGFAEGLAGREDLQQMLLELGFAWVSSEYPRHALGMAGEAPSDAMVEKIAQANDAAQPYRYPSGLVEVPMSAISDIGAFRTGRWKLEWFLRVIRAGIERAIERGGAFDFLGHPSCLYATDPQFKTIDLICDLVEASAGRAELSDLQAISQRAAA